MLVHKGAPARAEACRGVLARCGALLLSGRFDHDRHRLAERVGCSPAQAAEALARLGDLGLADGPIELPLRVRHGLETTARAFAELRAAGVIGVDQLLGEKSLRRLIRAPETTLRALLCGEVGQDRMVYTRHGFIDVRGRGPRTRLLARMRPDLLAVPHGHQVTASPFAERYGVAPDRVREAFGAFWAHGLVLPSGMTFVRTDEGRPPPDAKPSARTRKLERLLEHLDALREPPGTPLSARAIYEATRIKPLATRELLSYCAERGRAAYNECVYTTPPDPALPATPLFTIPLVAALLTSLGCYRSGDRVARDTLEGLLTNDRHLPHDVWLAVYALAGAGVVRFDGKGTVIVREIPSSLVAAVRDWRPS